jgi:hypothetical protein
VPAIDCLIAGVGAEVGLVVVDEDVYVEKVVTVERAEVSVTCTEEEDDDAASSMIEVLLEEDSELELLEAAASETRTELLSISFFFSFTQKC